ncbi:MAG TPA: J domain-containing protein [Isosphaeraceae bacterium]|jgi:hypothetical protein|nr:J domain-containing protein [Isosphaeraceae bacterium]
MAIDFQLDPAEVLGVPPGAPLQAIRDAYHDKARRHHPDQGGDAWAFRVVRRSFEVLSTARVVGRASEEFSRERTRPPIRPVNPADPAEGGEHVRPGVRDEVGDPVRLVDVELFLVRFQLDDPVELLTLSPAQRNLSCCLHVSWPSRELGRPAPGAAEAGPILAVISAAFDALARRTEGVASRCNAEVCRFVGWLNYPTAILASEAARAFRAALHPKGLGVVQSTRETIIPRDGH